MLLLPNESVPMTTKYTCEACGRTIDCDHAEIHIFQCSSELEAALIEMSKSEARPLPPAKLFHKTPSGPFSRHTHLCGPLHEETFEEYCVRRYCNPKVTE